ncbi:MAG: DNA-3-methyladenine glycosylase family protein [Oscillospiraceae bacterium]
MQCAEQSCEFEIKTLDDFDLKKIFECGQCFRWNENPDGSYTGVAMGRAARVRREGDRLFITGDESDFQNIWRGYFDLDRDYRVLRESVCIDDYMRRASEFGAGIRILNQDRWETLCSFLISQCNNIPRIKKIVETLCREFGEQTYLDGETYYTFPEASAIAGLRESDLTPLRAGYRAPYIIAAARAVASGELDLEALSKTDVTSARKALMAMPGIGEKVANCVILFSLRLTSAFPIDVWMKKAIGEHYPDGLDPAVFGDNAGLAQQYMFYYQRSGSM